MVNPADTKQQYEGAILQQLIKNSEDLAAIKANQDASLPQINALEKKIDEIYPAITFIKTLIIGIAIGVVVNIISPPFVNFFHSLKSDRFYN